MKASMSNPIGIETVTYRDGTKVMKVLNTHDEIIVYFSDRPIDLKVGNIKTVIPFSALVEAFAVAFNNDEFHLPEIDELVVSEVADGRT